LYRDVLMCDELAGGFGSVRCVFVDGCNVFGVAGRRGDSVSFYRSGVVAEGIVTLTERFCRALDSGAESPESHVAVSGSGGDRGVGDLTPDGEPVGHHLPLLTRRQSVSVWPEVW
jgi:hypothetical protein